jgi:hypothetical protein
LRVEQGLLFTDPSHVGAEAPKLVARAAREQMMFHLMIEADQQEVGQKTASDVAGGPHLLFKKGKVRISRD